MTGVTVASSGALARPDRTARPLARSLAGVALAVLAAQFLTVIMLAASIAPDYDISGGAISDLGVIPETALLFNASLAVAGILNVVAGWFLFTEHRHVGVLGAFVVAGGGALGAGLVPLDRGEAHSLFALLAFVSFNLEPLAIGRLDRGWFRTVSILVSVTGLAFTALMIAGDAGNPAVFGPIGHGGAERMIVYPTMLWLLVVGGRLTARTAGE